MKRLHEHTPSTRWMDYASPRPGPLSRRRPEVQSRNILSGGRNSTGGHKIVAFPRASAHSLLHGFCTRMALDGRRSSGRCSRGLTRFRTAPGAPRFSHKLIFTPARHASVIMNDGSEHELAGRAVRAGTGGLGKSTGRRTNPSATGRRHGYRVRGGAVAVRHGVLQFHPTALGVAGARPGFFCCPRRCAANAGAVEHRLERFMKRYNEAQELARGTSWPRDRQRDARTQSKHVFLDRPK